jgi:hypothetical protein
VALASRWMLNCCLIISPPFVFYTLNFFDK